MKYLPYAKTNVIQLKDGEISEIIIDPKILMLMQKNLKI